LRPTVNVLYLPGTNCQAETMRAFARVGAQPRLRFMRDVAGGTERIDDADILCIPGGFSFGDHLAAGTVAGLLLRTRLREQLDVCRTRPMLFICNGFQTAVRAGCFGAGVTLTANACGTFQNIPDQAHLVEPGNPSRWLAGLDEQVLTFPCAHGEGRFVYRQADSWRPALRYPEGHNPDGSMGGIAGITTPDGLTLGLMNHPERAIGQEANLAIFENGVRAATG
jgi:phosphoribosylformylglycinamidine (FGAM) synthase-like amidotransferase family enzyme